MEKIWIQELIKAEEQAEQTGIIDNSFHLDQDHILATESLQFLLRLKAEFTEALSAFNELKPGPLGRIKIYGIAKTHADFMLFRNGFKMIFSMKQAGQIIIRFNFIGAGFIPGTEAAQGTSLMDDTIIESQFAPFGEVKWTYQGKEFSETKMVQYYLSHFIRVSTR